MERKKIKFPEHYTLELDQLDPIEDAKERKQKISRFISGYLYCNKGSKFIISYHGKRLHVVIKREILPVTIISMEGVDFLNIPHHASLLLNTITKLQIK